MKLPFPSFWLRFKKTDALVETVAFLSAAEPAPFSAWEQDKSKALALISLELIRRGVPVHLTCDSF